MKVEIISLGNGVGFIIPVKIGKKLKPKKIIKIKINGMGFLKKLPKPVIYLTKKGQQKLFRIIIPKLIVDKYKFKLGQIIDFKIKLNEGGKK